MRAFPQALIVLALASGCTDSCACGEGGRDAPAPKAAEPHAAGHAAPTASEGGSAAEVTAAAAPSPSWQPAPDSELTRQLAAAKETLETEDLHEKLAEGKVLAAPLGARIGQLQADSDLSTTVREGSQAKLSIAARNYKLGNKTVRLKITDTGMLPNARGVVSRRLTLIGNEAVGNEHGAFVRGYPAVVAHFPEQQVSRASVVLANRYLVQVMVRGATEPEEALQVIEQLDFGQLAPKQGKVPKAGAKAAAE